MKMVMVSREVNVGFSILMEVLIQLFYRNASRFGGRPPPPFLPKNRSTGNESTCENGGNLIFHPFGTYSYVRDWAEYGVATGWGN